MLTSSLLDVGEDQCRQAVACGSDFIVVQLTDGSLHACSKYWGKWQRLSAPFSDGAYYAIARCGRSLWAVTCNFHCKSEPSSWTLHCHVKRTAFQRCTMPTWPECYSHSAQHELLLPAIQALPARSTQSPLDFSGFSVAALPSRSAQTAELIIAGGVIRDSSSRLKDSMAFMGAIIVNSTCGMPLKVVGCDSIPFDVGQCATIAVHEKTVFVLDKRSAIIGYAKLQVESTPDNMPCSFRFHGWKRLPLPDICDKQQGVDMAILKDHLVVFGGRTSRQYSSAVHALPVISCDDGGVSNGTWRRCPPMLQARSGHSSCMNSNNELIVVGGAPDCGQLTVECFTSPDCTCTEV